MRWLTTAGPARLGTAAQLYTMPACWPSLAYCAGVRAEDVGDGSRGQADDGTEGAAEDGEGEGPEGDR